MPVEHIQSQHVHGDVGTFYILNVFKFVFKPIDFLQVLTADLLHEKYLHLYQGALINSNHIQNRCSNRSSKDIDDEYYGTLRKSTIEEAIFKKLGYTEYLEHIKSMFQEWENDDEDDLYLENLRAFHQKSIEDLKLFDLSKTTFYTFSAPLIDYVGDFQPHWIYGRFVIAIGIQTDSNLVFVVNLGDD
jgi:hypothetical protein